MHTVELLEHAQAAAEQLGFRIRHEWLDGSGGGACEIAGQKWFFVDLALNAFEQLDQMIGELKHQPGINRLDLPGELSNLLEVRKAA